MAASLGLLLCVSVAVEGSWGWRVAGWGGSPDLVLVLVLVVSLWTGPEVGALVGFVGGWLQDLTGGGPLGLVAAAKLLVGFAVGEVARTVALEGVWVPSACALSATALSKLAELAVGWLIGEGLPEPSRWAQGAAVTACYNAAIAPLVSAGFRKAQRWKRILGSRAGSPLWP